MANPQILRPFSSCYYTCSTNVPSFVIGSCQFRFLVFILDHLVTTYSAMDGTQVNDGWETGGQSQEMINKIN